MCVAVGSNGEHGVVVRVVNGAAQPAIVAPGTTGLVSVACPKPDLCFAGGSAVPPEGAQTGDGAIVSVTANDVGAQQAVGGASNVPDLTCPDANDCVGVGEGVGGNANGIFEVNGGQVGPFQPVSEIDNATAGINRVSCAAPGYCVGITVDAALAITDGRIGPWTRIRNDPFMGPGLTDIDCWSTSNCIAAGGDFPEAYQIEGDARAGRPLQFDGLNNAPTAACSPSGTCYAAGSKRGDTARGALATFSASDLRFPGPIKFPGGCAVPRVTGLTIRAARKRLRRARCRVGHIRHVVATGFHRRVIEQDPARGRYPRGKKVGLVVGR